MDTYICLIAHAPYASAAYEVVKHVIGTQALVSVHDIAPDVVPDEMATQIQNEIARVRAQQPLQHLIVVSDLIGATPCNIGVRVVKQAICSGLKSEVICGMNIGMLLSLFRYRHSAASFSDLIEASEDGGIKGICNASLFDCNNTLF